MRSYIFHDVDPVHKRLLELADDIGYLILAEVVGRHHTEKIARVDFTPTDLAPFVQMPDAPREEFPEAGQLDDDEDDDDEQESEDTLGTLAGDLTAADLAKGAFRWVKETAGANMNCSKLRKFKLSVWSPKGDKLRYSTRFSCENPDWMDDEDEDDAPEVRKPPALMPAPAGYDQHLPVASPALQGTVVPASAGRGPTDRIATTMLMLDAIPEGRVWMALGGAVAHFTQMLQEGYDNLSKHQSAAINTQNTQILRNQKVLENLVGQVIDMRTGVAVADRNDREEAQGARVREELGKQFIAEIGGLGRTVAAAKFGLAPELAELADIVNSSPELAEAIKAPEVRRMLRDEKTRKELAAMLLGAAGVAEPAAQPPPQDEPKAA